MAELTLAAVVANDMAMKCSDDVRDAIHRTFRLLDSQGACVFAAVAASGMALAQVAGALYARDREQITGEALDVIWRDVMRPLALSAAGDSKDFHSMLDHIAGKAERIEGAA